MDAAVPAPLLQRAAGLEPVHPAVFPMSVPAEPGPDQVNKTVPHQLTHESYCETFPCQPTQELH